MILVVVAYLTKELACGTRRVTTVDFEQGLAWVCGTTFTRVCLKKPRAFMS